MIFTSPPAPRSPMLRAISSNWFADETSLIQRLLAIAELPEELQHSVQAQAAEWVTQVRTLRDEQSPLDSFMQEYDLSSEEGVLLMCLAEALLRIPDDNTAEQLIADKLSDANWDSHVGKSDSLFVNASTWGLMLTGKLVKVSPEARHNFSWAINRMIGKSSEPVIRLAIRQAMKMMGHQFVLGRTINEAIKESHTKEHRGYLHSFDMLGEAALTSTDAERYFQAYLNAIDVIGNQERETANGPVMRRPSISVKLSALHPRYEIAQKARVVAELTPKLLQLALRAKKHNIGLTVDAEESDRLELSLAIFEPVYRDGRLAGWNGLGLAIQAFQKRCLPVIDWLENLARTVNRQIPVRLVKGAYWDTEIKRAQEQGLEGYPVFTRKSNTDVSYLACARRLLSARDVFYPQFATHNAQTIAQIRAYSGDEIGYEYQRLHGMGEALYKVVGRRSAAPCRVYAPVGSHEDLLPYLVRRLLENGANTSFVNRIFDDEVAAEELAANPIAQVAQSEPKFNPAIPAPKDIFGSVRQNSRGINLFSEAVHEEYFKEFAVTEIPKQAYSAVSFENKNTGGLTPVVAPATGEKIGEYCPATTEIAKRAVTEAHAAFDSWSNTSVENRAHVLERAADQIEQAYPLFLKLLMVEAGKSWADATAEVREAVDFLRYYASQARIHMRQPEAMPGPTGEHNELRLFGRGVIVCISPWNFPLAIFLGQVSAALAAGNTVVAKPAEQTNLVAVAAVKILHECGVPKAALQCVLGEGDVGAVLIDAKEIAGVAFTGSVEVAKIINRALAAKDGAIVPLIAETGGQNAMIVDSSALPEQVVKDAISSAFQSAGQRCSALRVMYLQEEIADKVIHMLKGAMEELVIGDPVYLRTDVGPVIDPEAQKKLLDHISEIQKNGKLIATLALPEEAEKGFFVPPTAVEIKSMSDLKNENFGPVLHIIRFPAKKIDGVIDEINQSGFGLTLGIHSRIEQNWKKIQRRVRVGNCYVNRNQIGAVVGVQPFGGEGLSGTGPKAGGPHYLPRFCSERTLTVNTSAVGGNARLLAQTGNG